MTSHKESQAEREQRIRERADEARPNVSMTPGQAETLRRSAALRLSPAQERHMREMYVADGDPPMYWTTRRGSAQHRSALALVKKGLLDQAGDHSSWSFNNPGFTLTEEGGRVAAALNT